MTIRQSVSYPSDTGTWSVYRPSINVEWCFGTQPVFGEFERLQVWFARLDHAVGAKAVASPREVIVQGSSKVAVSEASHGFIAICIGPYRGRSAADGR